MATDGYTVAFNALKRIGRHNEPFQVLTHVEFDIIRGGRCEAVLYFEDILTGARKQIKTEMSLGKRRTVINPFTKKGPYFLNLVENAVKKFHTADADKN